MTTQVKSTQRAKPDAQVLVLTEDMLRHYTAEEVAERRLLPCSARWLEKQAYARRIPHTQVAGKLTFRLDQLLTISQSCDVAPMAGPQAA